MAGRWLDKAAAADYTGMRPHLFLRAVRAGRLPAPSRALGPATPRWDKDAIDAVLTGGAEPDTRAMFHGMAEKIEAEGRARREAREARRHAR